MTRRAFAIAALMVYLCVAAAPTVALPPLRPGLIDPQTQRYRTTGRKLPVIPKEVRQYRRPIPLGGIFPLVSGGAALPRAIRAATDNQVAPLVLLVDFAGQPASSRPSIADNAVFAGLFFGTGATDLSVANYWREVSYGKFVLSQPRDKAPADPARPDVAGWLRADAFSAIRVADIAGVQPGNVRQLLSDAIALLVSRGFDFRPYVRASDRSFHSVILVHSGYGQEDVDPADPNFADAVYSHTVGIDNIAVDVSGTTCNIVDYTIVPGLQAPVSGATDPAVDPHIGIGVIVHEMGHLFGLPDLYPTSTAGQVLTDNVFSGAGVFDLMAYGMWGNNLLEGPANPAHLSAWSKARLGWLAPTEVLVTAPRSLRPVEIFPEADLVYSNTRGGDPKQYFLLENRQEASSLGNWIFDRIGMQGILIWQIDNVVIDSHIATNNVNDNSMFRGVYVKEADGIPHMRLPIPAGTRAEQAPYYGRQEDLFPSPPAGLVFDNTSPSSAVNSRPIVDNTFTNHPFDFGQKVSIFTFSRSATDNTMRYAVGITGGGTSVPSWRTFNIASTQKYPLDNTAPVSPQPMLSNDILSLAFDSGNNTWMGSSDRGIFRFLGTRFDFLDSFTGLPAASPPAALPLSPVRAMAFESATGSMWVGTDRGLYKVRDSGSGFQVTDKGHLGGLGLPGNRVPATLAATANPIRSIVVRGGFQVGDQRIDIKYAATPAGLLRVDDLNNDAALDDTVFVILGGEVTAVALDDNGDADATNDILWVGDSSGNVYRSLLPGESRGPANADPVAPTHFKLMFTLAGTRITSLSVDKKGRLWIGTDIRGLRVFDLREILSPPDNRNLYDPFDFDIDGQLEQASNPPYLDLSRGLVSNYVSGISFQVTPDTDAVAWISHLQIPGGNPGGASRFDANASNDNVTIVDERVTRYLPEIGVLPENQVNGPASRSLYTVVADPAGNVWFGSTVPEAEGASRFGNAGIVSLDKGSYINYTDVATVTLQDDGRNVDPAVTDFEFVTVTSGGDPVGINLLLAETGPDTGVFQGRFGFTSGNTDGSVNPPLLKVANRGDVITVTYVDFDPPGVRPPATATWSLVYPFSDSLFINDLHCFIATAAYGSGMAPEVRTLRAFRDRFLLAVPFGEAVVGLYYRMSPPLARMISDRPALRFAARCLIAPVAMTASIAIGTAAGERAAILLLFIGVTAGCLLLRRRSGGSNRK